MNKIMELWIARDDSDDTLWAYEVEPFKCGNNFACENGTKMMFQIPKELFPEVTFENSPQKCELEINNLYNMEEKIEEIFDADKAREMLQTERNSILNKQLRYICGRIKKCIEEKGIGELYLKLSEIPDYKGNIKILRERLVELKYSVVSLNGADDVYDLKIVWQ